MNLDAWSIILGALLAVLGGAINDEIRIKRLEQRELKYMKIGLIDELNDIESNIKNMKEVWEKTKTLHRSYVEGLSSNTGTFDNSRSRFYLIQNVETRKTIIDFYKKLKTMVKESEGKVGTLATTAEATAEQEKIGSTFIYLGIEAAQIRALLEK